jgi:hypothetical protein
MQRPPDPKSTLTHWLELWRTAEVAPAAPGKYKSILWRLFFPQTPASAPVRYTFAAVSCIMAFVSRLLLDPLLQERSPLIQERSPLILFALLVAVCCHAAERNWRAILLSARGSVLSARPGIPVNRSPATGRLGHSRGDPELDPR